jgi:hypothetical protein
VSREIFGTGNAWAGFDQILGLVIERAKVELDSDRRGA